ncbi:MAG TPA: alpha-ketoglutarate-dependent dioxygenase AlkB [Bacteroidia bacterium]|jgi:alkylated DNA repair dioxygenase AlkB
MDLFSSNEPSNILPYDGMALYYGRILTDRAAGLYFDTLLNTIEWKNDEALIYGKHIITPRKVAWYADKPFSYTYSGTTKHALAWTKELHELKKTAEDITQHTYNSCLLNLYHNGDEGMAWHSDDEKALAKNSAIASFSFGAERKFSFKHKRTGDTASLVLENGSLLVMCGPTQANWLHRLPPTVKVKRPRINLTFRTMVS